MCGGPLPWWTEEMEKDKEQQEQNNPVAPPEEKVSIENGIADTNAGKLNPNSKAKDIYRKWL